MPFCKNCRRHNTQQSFAGAQIARCRRCDSRICRVCGCTNERACPEGCSWSLVDPTCCSEHEPPATKGGDPEASAPAEALEVLRLGITLMAHGNSPEEAARAVFRMGVSPEACASLKEALSEAEGRPSH